MLHSSILEYHTSQNNTYIYSCTTQSITQMDAEFVKYEVIKILIKYNFFFFNVSSNESLVID